MASQQQIIEVLNRLGNTQQNSIALTSLAREIKQKQTSTKIAIEACVNLISRLANRGNQMEDVLRAAREAEGKEDEYISQLTEILSGSPTQQEIDTVIRQLRDTVSAQVERDPNFGDGVMDAQQRQVLGLRPVDGGVDGQGNSPPPANQLQGGFNWRSSKSKTVKRKKSVRRTIKRSNSRRKIKTKTKTRRTKSKRSN